MGSHIYHGSQKQARMQVESRILKVGSRDKSHGLGLFISINNSPMLRTAVRLSTMGPLPPEPGGPQRLLRGGGEGAGV